MSFMLSSQVLSPLFCQFLNQVAIDHCYDHAWMSHMQATLSSISSFSAEGQWSLLMTSYCSCFPSPISYHLCAPRGTVSLMCPARGELEVQYFSSIYCSPNMVVSLKHWKSIVLVPRRWVQCALCSIICASILVLVAVAGWQKRSSFPMVHTKVENMNSELFSSFSAGHALMPWSRMEAWW